MLPWTPESDRLLLKLVEKNTDSDNGWVDWVEVVTHFPARTSEACRMRVRYLAQQDTAVMVSQDDRPTFQELFQLLRDHPQTLEQISNHFDRSPKHIKDKLDQMEAKGYALVVTQDNFAVKTSTLPEAAPPEIRIADLMGKSFSFAIASDWHVGSKHSQPTRLNQFLKLAYEEHGVRHVMVPGDLTDGAFVYGQRHLDDLIPNVRPLNRSRTWMTAEAEVELLKTYAPKMDGLRYYAMGGNHDKTLISNAGLDPVRMLCDARDDFHYGGYHLWSVRLTDKCFVRMIHPRGGGSYAKSYKLQKRMEQLAFEALREAMAEDQPPMTSILIMGHFHSANYNPDPPMHGILAGCFQGSTTLLKELGLTPAIGGWIVEVQFEKYGRLSSVWPKPVFLEEIHEDWKRWPTPEMCDPNETPDELGVLFHVDGSRPVPLEETGQPKND